MLTAKQRLLLMTSEQRAMLAWAKGSLRHTTRPHAQRRLYDAIHARKREEPNDLTVAVLNCHRRLGKSHMLTMLAIERCLSRPYQEVKYGAPTRDQCRQIVRPLLHQILLQCPSQLYPDRSGFEYRFNNPAWGDARAYSTLQLVGCNVDDGNRLRGQAADLVLLDEVREVPNLDYIVSHVLAHQFQRRHMPMIVMATTPPESMAHDFVQRFIPWAQATNSYWCIPAQDNEDCSEDDERIVLRMCSNKKSVAWRREMGCELVSDPENLITPEFQGLKDDILVDEWVKPEWYQPYTIIDGAYRRDNLSMGFCYADFAEQVLVFEDSELMKEKTLRVIAEAARAGEGRCFPEMIKAGKAIRRMGDMTALELESLAADYSLPMREVEKYDKDSAVMKFRHQLEDLRVKVVADRDEFGNPRKNVGLINQLEHGIYNRGHTDFARTEELGHWDAGMMAVYASRMVNMRENPRPGGVAWDQSWQHYTARPGDAYGGDWERHNRLAEAFKI